MGKWILFRFVNIENISERDMDLLFMEAFATDAGFLNLFISKTDCGEKHCSVVHAERSKIDHGLGESDITVIFEVEGGEKSAPARRQDRCD